MELTKNLKLSGLHENIQKVMILFKARADIYCVLSTPQSAQSKFYTLSRLVIPTP